LNVRKKTPIFEALSTCTNHDYPSDIFMAFFINIAWEHYPSRCVVQGVL